METEAEVLALALELAMAAAAMALALTVAGLLGATMGAGARMGVVGGEGEGEMARGALAVALGFFAAIVAGLYCDTFWRKSLAAAGVVGAVAGAMFGRSRGRLGNDWVASRWKA